MLRAEGVDVVFGIIDGTYYGFYRSLPEEGIRLVTPRHETSALHMAAAYGADATAQERATLWPRLLDIYPSYGIYQERTDRELPVVVLEPRGDLR